MVSIIYLICFYCLTASNLFSNSFFPLKNELEYRLIEYGLLSSSSNDIFVMNQPYETKKVLEVLSMSNLDKLILSKYDYLTRENIINLKLSLGLNNVIYDTKLKSYFNTECILNFDSVILYNSIAFDKALKDDVFFHGDKNEWATAYIYDSFLQYSKNNLKLFAGRTSRNFGVPNEYGLLLSNNPYPFDHFGLTVENTKIKYSFYFSRLNDMENSQDSEGIIIPIGESSKSKRYFSIQRLDFKISSKIQGALAASTIYGGPNQNLDFSFINPANIYYLSQRNKRVQMNNFYQLNLYYKFKNNALYFDFLIDDFIINNEPGMRDTDPDRLGLILKLSSTDIFFDKNIISLRYLRIWSQTYITFRNFENYIYFSKGLGYPQNNIESLMLSMNFFNFKNILSEIFVEFYQKGNSDLSSIFINAIESFPSGDIENGINFRMRLSYLIFKKIEYSIDLSFNKNKYQNIISDSFDMNFKLVYNFQL